MAERFGNNLWIAVKIYDYKYISISSRNGELNLQLVKNHFFSSKMLSTLIRRVERVRLCQYLRCKVALSFLTWNIFIKELTSNLWLLILINSIQWPSRLIKKKKCSFQIEIFFQKFCQEAKLLKEKLGWWITHGGYQRENY